MSAKADVIKALGGGDICVVCDSPSAVVTRRSYDDGAVTRLCAVCADAGWEVALAYAAANPSYDRKSVDGAD